MPVTGIKVAFFSAVIFNMHDSDGDGLVTLEDYRHVSFLLNPKYSKGPYCNKNHLNYCLSVTWKLRISPPEIRAVLVLIFPGGGGVVISQRSTGERNSQSHC